MSNKYLSWFLDSSEEIDPNDPLGTVRITGQAENIEELDIFLDTFFAALVTGAQELDHKSEVSADIVDEPYPIQLEIIAGSVMISCQERRVEIGDFDRFKNELLVAVKDFIGQMDAASGARNEPILKMRILRNFVKAGSAT